MVKPCELRGSMDVIAFLSGVTVSVDGAMGLPPTKDRITKVDSEDNRYPPSPPMVELSLVEVFSPFVSFHLRPELCVLEQLQMVKGVRVTKNERNVVSRDKMRWQDRLD